MAQLKEVAVRGATVLGFVAGTLEWVSGAGAGSGASVPPAVPRQFQRERMIEEPRFHVYAILCEGDNVYVGRIDADGKKTIEDRYKEHEVGLGSEWTKRHRPIRNLETAMNQDKWAEDTMVFRYMEKYGRDSVRGGSFSQMEFTPSQERELDKKFKSVDDVCFHCGSKEHFAKDCPQQSEYRPARKKKSNRKHERAAALPASPPPSYSEAIADSKESQPCFRCGKVGHWADKCPEQKDRKIQSCFRCGKVGHRADKCQETTTKDGAALHKYSKWMFKPKS